jgi:hypothetical protein
LHCYCGRCFANHRCHSRFHQALCRRSCRSYLQGATIAADSCSRRYNVLVHHMLYFILPSQRLIEKNDFRHSKGAY